MMTMMSLLALNTSRPTGVQSFGRQDAGAKDVWATGSGTFGRHVMDIGATKYLQMTIFIFQVSRNWPVIVTRMKVTMSPKPPTPSPKRPVA